MLGHGHKRYPFKPNDVSIIVAKSSDPKDLESIDLALVKIKKESDFNPWKGYDDFRCYDVDFINTKTIDYRCDAKGSGKNRIFDIARSIGTGHQNSANCRDLALYLFLDNS
mgnify:CR=1 FL=1